MTRTLPRPQAWSHGIYAIDSGYVRPHFDAIHLVIEDGRAALVDTGTNHSVPAVLAALASLGISNKQVDWILLTHVHLDHAGGAGTLMQRLPHARLAVHPRGARHMADPARLWAGTVAVYGLEAAREAYGELAPVPVSRIVETGEGASIELASRRFDFIDTPGHARHHVVIRDSANGHLFAGDMFGISYREFDVAGCAFIFPSSTPVQFDPDDTLHSIGRMLALAPPAIYLTHWSRVEDIPRLGALLERLVHAYVRIAKEARDALAESSLGESSPAGSSLDETPLAGSASSNSESSASASASASASGGGRALRERLEARIRGGLSQLYLDALREHGSSLDDATILRLLAMDIELNAAGLVDWLQAKPGTRN